MFVPRAIAGVGACSHAWCTCGRYDIWYEAEAETLARGSRRLRGIILPPVSFRIFGWDLFDIERSNRRIISVGLWVGYNARCHYEMKHPAFCPSRHRQSGILQVFMP